MWSTLFIIQFIVTCCALPILLIINLFQWRVESKIHQEVGDIPRLLHRLLPISCLFLITFIIPDTSHDIHFIHNLLADLNSTLLLYGLTLIVYHTRATIARTDSTEIKHRKRWCHVVGISTACCALGVNIAEYHMDRLWPHTIFLIWYFTCLLIHIIAVLIFLLRLISLLEHHNVIMTGQNHSLSSLNPTSRFIRVTPTIASPTTVGRKLHPSGSSFSLPPSAHRRPSYHTLQKIAQDIARAQLISRFRVRVLLLVVPGVAALISLAASAVYLLANLSTPYGGAPNYASFIYCLIHICSITCATAFGWLTVTRIICQQILCCNQHIDMIPSHHRTPSTHSINKKTRTPKKEGIHVNLHPTSIPQSSPTERDSVLIEPSPLSATHVVKAFNAVPPAQLAEITSPSSSPSPCPSPSTSRTDDNLQHVPSVPSFVVMLLNAQQSQQSSHHPSPSTSLSHKAHTQHVHEMVTLHEFGPIAILSQDVSSSTSRMSMVEQQQSMVSDEKRHVSIVSDEKRHVSIVSDAKRHVSIDEKRHSMDEKRNSIDDHHISISQKPATIEEQDTDVTSDMV